MPNIVHRVGIAAEPSRVFQALTTTDGICGWWNSQTEGNASEGGTFQFSSNRLEVIHADPGVVKWRYSGLAEDWVGTEIIFRLERREGQTIVLFDHEGWRESNEFMHHCSTKWATFLLSLKDLVETGEGRPEPYKDTKIAADA
jgi:uncharacterized protein YndB with AHSA1/START domain